MLIPAALSLTWYQDDDWHSDQHESYYEDPKVPSRAARELLRKLPPGLQRSNDTWNLLLNPSLHQNLLYHPQQL